MATNIIVGEFVLGVYDLQRVRQRFLAVGIRIYAETEKKNGISILEIVRTDFERFANQCNARHKSHNTQALRHRDFFFFLYSTSY